MSSQSMMSAQYIISEHLLQSTKYRQRPPMKIRHAAIHPYRCLLLGRQPCNDTWQANTMHAHKTRHLHTSCFKLFVLFFSFASHFYQKRLASKRLHLDCLFFLIASPRLPLFFHARHSVYPHEPVQIPSFLVPSLEAALVVKRPSKIKKRKKSNEETKGAEKRRRKNRHLCRLFPFFILPPKCPQMT